MSKKTRGVADERLENTIADKPIDLETFECLVYGRDYAGAITAGIRVLSNLRRAVTFDGHQNSEKPIHSFYTRLAAAFTAMLADPGFMLSELGFHLLCREHESLDAIFAASEFEGMEHLAPQFSTPRGERNPEKIRFGNPQDVVKFAVSWTLGSRIDFAYDQVAAASDAARWLMFPWYLALVSQQVVISPLAHDRREKLLGQSAAFENTPMSVEALQQASEALMYCSYGTRRDKHDVKRLINAAIRKLIPMPAALPPRPVRKKPLLLISLEWSLSLHAMFRVYGAALAQLRERFEVVGLQHHLDREPDGPMLEVCDRIVKGERGSDLESVRKLIERVIRIAPDVIYYPSIGMMTNSAIMGALRLAPLQVQSYGHPATAGSTEIDFGITEEGSCGDESLHQERLYYTPDGALQFVERTDQVPPDARGPRAIEGEDPVIVGVPAMVLKLSVPFLFSLREIAEKAKARGRVVEYRFFPNLAWLPYHRAAKEIARWFPRVKVFPRFFYDAYMAQLRDCDLIFSTFPFGGSNSHIDAMLMGVPILVRDGVEIHERYDGMMLRRIGMGDLVAPTTERYEELALELICDDALRAKYAMSLSRERVRQEFFGPRRDGAAGAFGRAMWQLWENRERLTAPDAPRSVHWKEFTP